MHNASSSHFARFRLSGLHCLVFYCASVLMHAACHTVAVLVQALGESNAGKSGAGKTKNVGLTAIDKTKVVGLTAIASLEK